MKDLTEEQRKAYEAWLKDTAALGSPREAFCAGFEAALANRPIVVETIHLIAQQQQREEIRVRMMKLSVEACQRGFYERAKYYSQLAEELFGKV